MILERNGFVKTYKGWINKRHVKRIFTLSVSDKERNDLIVAETFEGTIITVMECDGKEVAEYELNRLFENQDAVEVTLITETNINTLERQINKTLRNLHDIPIPCNVLDVKIINETQYFLACIMYQ